MQVNNTYNKGASRPQKQRPPKRKALQDAFLKYCVLSEDLVQLSLLKGKDEQGYIVDSDQFTILFHIQGAMLPMLVYKANIASIRAMTEGVDPETASRDFERNLDNIATGKVNDTLKRLK